jgi:flagellar basal-body rod protein FlgF
MRTLPCLEGEQKSGAICNGISSLPLTRQILPTGPSLRCCRLLLPQPLLAPSFPRFSFFAPPLEKWHGDCCLLQPHTSKGDRMFIQNRLGLIESVETMRGQEKRLEQISNNLANVDTGGYRKDEVSFREMLYTAASGRQRVGKSVKIMTDHAVGPVTGTGNAFDLSIAGDGFFQVQTPDGIRYTRAGNFRLDDQGQLVTANGHPVLGEGGAILIGSGEPAVTPDGSIFVDGEQAGRLAIADFTDRTVLEKEGLNYFRVRGGMAEEIVPAGYRVSQGYLEGANVNVVNAMTEMIDLHRLYEAQQKMISAIDEVDGQATRRVGSLTSS